jgi:hypothetical protein
MKRIAIITATPPGINPGMLAGEAAARSIISRAGLLEDTTFFRVVKFEERLASSAVSIEDTISACDVGIKFVHLEDPDILDDHVTLFWGDFLHMRRYIKALAGANDHLEEIYREVLLLASRPESTCRSAISYGTSLLFNSTIDELSTDYGAPLRRLLSLAAHVQMRDSVSAARVANFRPHARESCGVDPAQMMAVPEISEEILGDIERNTLTNHALIYLARAYHCHEYVIDFIAKLSFTMGVNVRWLPWGDKLSFPYMDRESWPWETSDLPNKTESSPGILQRLLATIASSPFVITDTYHVAVSSWSLGIPAIVLLGDFHPRERIDKQVDIRVRLDKRTQVLGQDGLLDFCIANSLIKTKEQRTQVVARLADILMTGEFGPNFRNALSIRVKASEAALLNALKEVRSQ